jgi:glycosyltransferase involved in cell wall biosynthesis
VGLIAQLSLIIAVYNKPEILRLVLAACMRQSFTDFEVIIADDGSEASVRDVITWARERAAFPIVHLWQEDRGWRKNVILNKAIRASRTDYLVFIDGDCLPARDFLKDHSRERKPHSILLGRRVETSRRWSDALTLERINSGEFEKLGWRELMDGLTGESLRVEDGIRLRSALLRRLLLRNVEGILGSNFSAAREDLYAINGFDEEYNGPGLGEDSDLQFRLSLIGVHGISLRNLAIQYHVWHPPTQVSEHSRERFSKVKSTSDPRCALGLEKLSRISP